VWAAGACEYWAASTEDEAGYGISPEDAQA